MLSVVRVYKADRRMSDAASTEDSVASLEIGGVQARSSSWEMAGRVTGDGKLFYARAAVTEQPPEDGMILRGTFYEISVKVYDEDEAPCDMVGVLRRIGNGEHYLDEDGDFDYKAADMPEEVWQTIYGRIFAPVTDDCDEDPVSGIPGGGYPSRA
jgi:hypothetical protein